MVCVHSKFVEAYVKVGRKAKLISAICQFSELNGYSGEYNFTILSISAFWLLSQKSNLVNQTVGTFL